MTLLEADFSEKGKQTQYVHSRISINGALRWFYNPKIIEGATLVD
jgi:hypothetical protein